MRLHNRICVQDATPVRADVDTSEDTRVAADAAEARAVLVLVVVDANPVFTDVVAAPDRFETSSSCRWQIATENPCRAADFPKLRHFDIKIDRSTFLKLAPRSVEWNRPVLLTSQRSPDLPGVVIKRPRGFVPGGSIGADVGGQAGARFGAKLAPASVLT